MTSNVTTITDARDKRDAEYQRYCEHVALMKLYWMQHLRLASSVSELQEWARATLAPGETIDADAILTKDERAQAMQQVRRNLA